MNTVESFLIILIEKKEIQVLTESFLLTRRITEEKKMQLPGLQSDDNWSCLHWEICLLWKRNAFPDPHHPPPPPITPEGNATSFEPTRATIVRRKKSNRYFYGDETQIVRTESAKGKNTFWLYEYRGRHPQKFNFGHDEFLNSTNTIKIGDGPTPPFIYASESAPCQLKLWEKGEKKSTQWDWEKKVEEKDLIWPWLNRGKTDCEGDWEELLRCVFCPYRQDKMSEPKRNGGNKCWGSAFELWLLVQIRNGTMALRSRGYSPRNFCKYQSWCVIPRGTKLASVKMKKANADSWPVAIAKPSLQMTNLTRLN